MSAQGIEVTSPTSATQRATWGTTAAEGTYFAAVTRTSHRDDRGADGWAWELAYSPADGVGFHYTGARPDQLIYAPMGGALEVLETLSAFVGAWDDAQRYPDSENRDLFPTSCLDFLGAAEEFAADVADRLELEHGEVEE